MMQEKDSHPVERYFGARSVAIMVLLTISLLVLPAMLPPLPPPPAVLLFVPVLLMAFLVLLALSSGQIPKVVVTPV